MKEVEEEDIRREQSDRDETQGVVDGRWKRVRKEPQREEEGEEKRDLEQTCCIGIG